MLFIVALIISVIFVTVCHGKLKKYSNIFYISAALLSIAVYIAGCYITMPVFVQDYIVGIFARGSLGTAFFVLVMYAGAMDNTWKTTRILMKVRAELSIIGCILVLCHNFTYGRVYFRALFTNPEMLLTTQKAAAGISLILITIMLILTFTSFPYIRKKMKPLVWKRLQRMAYIFYGLIYVHILLINIPYARNGITEYIINVIVYSLVFVNYAVMRIQKAVINKLNRLKCSDDKKNTYVISIKAVVTLIGMIIVVGVMCMCFIGTDNIEAESTGNTSYSQITDDSSNNKDSKNNSQKSKENNGQNKNADKEGNELADLENSNENMDLNINKDELQAGNEVLADNFINESNTENLSDGNMGNNIVSDTGSSDNTTGNINAMGNVNNVNSNNMSGNIYNNNTINGNGKETDNNSNNNSNSAASGNNADSVPGGNADNNSQYGNNDTPENNSDSSSNNEYDENQDESTPSDNSKQDTPRRFKADGVYTASVKCQQYNYMVTVKVIIASDRIEAVSASSEASKSNVMFFNMAADVIPDRLVSAQGSQGVDAVSGATYSSNAIISAFNNAVN